VRQDGSESGHAEDPEPRHYVFPPVRQGGAVSCARLVAGLVGPSRDDGDAIVGGHLLIGGVHVRLVTVRAGDPRSQVVADHYLVTAAHELKCVGVTAHPVQELLGGEGLGEQVARRPGHGDEQLGS
jgi:hypothetical protein